MNNIFLRISLSVVYIWFGALKLFDLSPASPMVKELLESTLPFISFGQFIIILGIFEVIIGILLLLPKLFPKQVSPITALTFSLILIHLILTTGPIVLLPQITWSGTLVPTLGGQYIIKNILILAIALHLFKSRQSRD